MNTPAPAHLSLTSLQETVQVVLLIIFSVVGTWIALFRVPWHASADSCLVAAATMNETRIRLTREELYKKVWAAPMKATAQEFKVSTSTLANLCPKSNIPPPPVGHWTKVELGHKITPPPLPDSSGNQEVEIYVRERLSPELGTVAAEVPPKVPIPQELSHAAALKTQKLLASGKENDKKLLVPKAGTVSHLLVSRQQLPRALRILNALFLAPEERGHVVSWPNKEGEHLAVHVEGESVAISMQEIVESKPHVLTSAEKEHTWMAPKWDYKLTGRLRFSINNLPYLSHVRGTWADGRIQIVENCIGDFIIGLKVAAAAMKKSRLEREERERRWEEERKKNEERQRRAEEHNRRAKFISGLIDNWEKSNRVRTFVRALTEAANRPELPEEKKRDVQQVLDWTTRYADFLDPLTDLAGSIDEFVHPERKYPWLKHG